VSYGRRQSVSRTQQSRIFVGAAAFRVPGIAIIEQAWSAPFFAFAAAGLVIEMNDVNRNSREISQQEKKRNAVGATADADRP